ncbi:MAG: FAD-dependent monooxygenase [Corynebacteriales bacterium]|nr:FAD-dependent monooxygenase [Mycobacteriales bacterium]
MTLPQITIAGAGPVGALVAALLARQGHEVTIYESREDPRRAGFKGGRSINFSLTERGFHALEVAGVRASAERFAIPMRGRMVHHLNREPELHKYGRDQKAQLHSINRGTLTMMLLDVAEKAGAKVFFQHKITDVEFLADEVRISFSRGDGTTSRQTVPFILGADGAGSRLRAAMNEVTDLGETVDRLHYGYKELQIPARVENTGDPFLIDGRALHLWPRGDYLTTALPNISGSFTATLFMPLEGDSSFTTLNTGAKVRSFFDREFPSLSALLPDLESEFFANPTGSLATLHLRRWHLDRRALLIGDAAHAILPFHGQGMNCGFEDATELAALFQRDMDVREKFARFEQQRRPNTEAIAAMSLDNFTELRSRVREPGYRLRDELRHLLAVRHPERFLSRYELVSFTRVPYAEARERGNVQERLLRELTVTAERLAEVDIPRADRLITSQLPLLATR